MAKIPNYSAPQSVIRQILSVVSNSNVAPRLAVIVGQAFQVQRYGIDPKVTGTAFDANGQTVPFLYKDSVSSSEAYKDADRLADDSFTKLFGENLEAEYFNSVSASATFKIASLTEPSTLRLVAATNLAGSSLHASLHNYGVQIGDTVKVTTSAGTRKRVVTGFVGRALTASYGSDGSNGVAGNSNYNPITANPPASTLVTVSVPQDYTLSADTAFKGLIQGSLLEGKYGEEFLVTVAAPGIPGVATFNIASTSGLFSATAVASTDVDGNFVITSTALGGATLTINNPVAEDPIEAGLQFRFRLFGSYQRLSTSQFVLSNTGAGYTGPRDTTYTIRVVSGTATGYTGAVLEISDTAGVDVASQVTVVSDVNFAIGSYGLRAKFSTVPALPAQGGLRTGDVFYVQAVAASSSTTVFDGVTLDGPAVDTGAFLDASVAMTEVSFRLAYTGEIARTAAASGTAWSVDTLNGVTVLGGLSLYMAGRSTGHQWVSFVTGEGMLYPTWRAALPASTLPVLLNSADYADVAANFGRITPANDLAFACALALKKGQAIYALAVESDSAADYSSALDKLANADKYYSLGILSDRRDVRQAVSAHVTALSSKSKKRWRIAFCATASPGSYAVIDLTELAGNFTATISSYSGGNRLVTATFGTAGDGFIARGIAAGDRFLLGSGQEYEVESVLTNTELVLVSGPAAPISPAVPYKVFKADTAVNQAQFVAEESQALGDRRVRNVWIEGATAYYDGQKQVIAPKFHAAELAAARAAIAPQQGLTRYPVTASTSAASTYTRYNEDTLNTMAAAGTLVLAEDADQGGVYVRHQLTTGVDGGLLYYEDSITAVADALAFQFKAIVDSFVGKKNVTARTLSEINHALTITLNSATQVSTADLNIGALITNYEKLSVVQNPVLLDRVSVSVEVSVAVPLNGVDADISYVPATIVIAI